MRGMATAYVAVSATGRTAAYGLWAVRSRSGRRSALCRGERCPRDIRKPHEALRYAMGRALELMREKWPGLKQVEFVSRDKGAIRHVRGIPAGMEVTSRRSHSHRGYMRWCRERARDVVHGRKEAETPHPDIAAALED